MATEWPVTRGQTADVGSQGLGKGRCRVFGMGFLAIPLMA